MKLFSHIIALLLFPFSLIAQIAFDNIKAPELQINAWMDVEPALKDKTIILEFWATWCGGCIEAIPHINEMAEKYGNEDVIFISMNSFDKKEKIEKFLQKTKMSTYIAMDDEMKTYNDFNVGAMPKTYLIDKNGLLRWQGVPGLVTDEFMQSYLEKNEILVHKVMENPLLYSLNISLTKDRSISNVSAIDGDKFGFIWRNRGITDVIYQSYSFIGKEAYEFRMEGKIPLEPALDIKLLADQSINKEFVFNDVVDKLSGMFGFSIKDTIEEMEIWHLNITDENLLNQAKSAGQEADFSFEETRNEWKLKNCEAYRMIGTIKQLSEKIIKSEFNGVTKYDLVLPTGDLNLLIKVLKEQYGLSLEMKSEDVKVRIIRFK